MNLLAALDSRHVRICIPLITLTGTFTALSDENNVGLIGMVESMDMVEPEPLRDVYDALEIAEVLTLMGVDDLPAAHTAVAARKHDMHIVTLDRASWRPIEAQLPWAIHVVELADNPDL
ncbi:hypothetical protein ACWDUL_20800 [Nocardia niigatensis]